MKPVPWESHVWMVCSPTTFDVSMTFQTRQAARERLRQHKENEIQNGRRPTLTHVEKCKIESDGGAR
jgi:hypothetical protein